MKESLHLSYWDKKRLATKVDVLIVGAGISGLSCALRMAQLRPEMRIRVIDRHHITRLASTRNAGFVCFGSLTEIADDMKAYSETVALDLVERRFKGMELIRKTFTPGSIEYFNHGGFELIPHSSMEKDELEQHIEVVNTLLSGVVGKDVFEIQSTFESHPFATNQYLLKNRFEGQLNPALYVQQLYKKLPQTTVELYSGLEVKGIDHVGDHVVLDTTWGNMRASQVVLATNGLTGQLGLEHDKITPARNMVLVSEKTNLPFKGVYHAEKGFIYFRNVDSRLLIGGGRHWDMENEFTGEMGVNQPIIDQLKSYVAEVILPHRPKLDFPIQWSGIMGMTQNKLPIIKKIEDQLFLAAGFSGMGVALGMHGGFQLAEMVCKENFH